MGRPVATATPVKASVRDTKHSAPFPPILIPNSVEGPEWPCRILTPPRVRALFLACDRTKEPTGTMIRTGSRIDGANTTAQRTTDAERKLAKAEARIGKLQNKVDDQQQQIRELLARIDERESIIAEHAELQAEIRDLRSEARELTRANREQVKKNEALQAENARLKVEAKARKRAA
jgi:FtsZ-binding cell division protein ZapB